MSELDIKRIMEILPHRYPMLLVDRITELVPMKRAVGYKNLTMNEQFFQGHFPGLPVMPGVLMIEGMAQTASILALRLLPPPVQQRTMFFLTIDKAKFRKPARPGDILEYHVDKLSRRRSMWWYRGEAKVGDVLIAEAEVGAYLSEE